MQQSVKGSTVLFTALLKKCIEKGVVAICRYTARKNTPPRFVALFPQVLDLSGLFVSAFVIQLIKQIYAYCLAM